MFLRSSVFVIIGVLCEFSARCCGIFFKKIIIYIVYSLLYIYAYEFDLHVFYCIRSSKKIAKLIEQKLTFSYIIEELIGDETNSVCT